MDSGEKTILTLGAGVLLGSFLGSHFVIGLVVLVGVVMMVQHY